jgi:hypothetical protein
MLSKQEEDQERRETLENDRLVREAEQRRILLEGTTMFQHGQSQADEINQGRFAATGVPHVTGSQPIPKVPQLPESSPWSGAQPEPGIEPPLGFDNPALEPSAAFQLHAEQLGAPAADEALASEGDRPSAGVQAEPPSSDAVETASAGAPRFSNQQSGDS